MLNRIFKTISSAPGCFLALMATALLTAGNGQALTIDNFSSNGKAETTDLSSPVFTVVSSSNSIGGHRTLRALKLSGDLGIRLETIAGLLNHSQDASVTGLTQVSWDGNNATPSFNTSGLGGIDLTQDGGTAFRLKVNYFDYAGNKPIDITLTVYDTISGTSASQTYTFNQEIVSPTVLTFPFADFVASGESSPLSMTSVGALSIDIKGLNPSSDLTMDLFDTNGQCPQVPNMAGRVIDDCGVCGGSNQDKDSCGVCNGGNQDLDSCGVCFGMNRDLDDCGVCGGNNLSKDLCGVCGGDSSTCKDCSGTPNGGAMVDVCQVCGGNGKSCIDCQGVPFGASRVDACGVCDGDGRSCLRCETIDVSTTLQKMLAKTNEQRANAIFFIEKVKKADKRFAKKVRKQIDTVYNSLVKQIKALPAKVTQCDPNPLCVTSSNAPTVEIYNKNVVTLQQISTQILKHKVPSQPGKCNGDLKSCIKRQKEQASGRRTLLSLVKTLARENKVLAGLLPLTASVCSE
jgi:hypothetical protein